MSGSWPSSTYAPETEYGVEVRRHLKDFQKSLLAKHTDIVRISAVGDSEPPEERSLDEDELEETLQATRKTNDGLVEVYFIYKYLMSQSTNTAPPDANKLQISPKSFQTLISYYGVSAAFAFAVSRAYLPVGRGCRQIPASSEDGLEFDFWYILPIRVQVKCTDRSRGHASSTAGNNQMDPSHYLHLEDGGVDLRGSTIAVYSKHNMKSHRAVSIVISSADGRWPFVADEPQRRIFEVLDHYATENISRPDCFLHLVQLTSALRWWTNSLNSINLQLISYEKRLQEEMDKDEPTASKLYAIVNRGLHSIAAHLQRYRSELNSIHDTAELIQTHAETFRKHAEPPKPHDIDNTALAMSQIFSQLFATEDFAEELEKRAQNNLALVGQLLFPEHIMSFLSELAKEMFQLFHRMQITSDRLQISSGTAIQEILRATREEALLSRQVADESRRLARAMKRDSVAMKAIAIVTMFFLPGASFAALLSMPFFEESDLLVDAGKFWIWIILTVPSTAVAFVFYWYWRKRDDRKRSLDDASVSNSVELV